MDTFECKTERSVMDSWTMNNIVKCVAEDADKVKLVDLWTTAKRLEGELKTLKRLVDALPTRDY